MCSRSFPFGIGEVLILGARRWDWLDARVFEDRDASENPNLRCQFTRARHATRLSANPATFWTLPCTLSKRKPISEMDTRSAYALSVLAPDFDDEQNSRTQIQNQFREFILEFRLNSAFIYRFVLAIIRGKADH
jgi:hypothetical protein